MSLGSTGNKENKSIDFEELEYSPTKVNILVRSLNSDMYRKDRVRVMAFYLYLRGISHNGSIHRWRKNILSLRRRFGVSDRTFRSYVGELRRIGLIEESKEGHIYPKSLRRVVIEKGIMRDPKEMGLNKTAKIKKRKLIVKDFRDLCLKLQLAVLENNISKQERMITRKEKKFYKGMNKDTSALRAAKASSSPRESSIGRIKIAKLLGYKSASSGSRVIKRGVGVGCVQDKVNIRIFSKGDHERFIEEFGNVKGCFYRPIGRGVGFYMERSCNSVKFNLMGNIAN